MNTAWRKKWVSCEPKWCHCIYRTVWSLNTARETFGLYTWNKTLRHPVLLHRIKDVAIARVATLPCENILRVFYSQLPVVRLLQHPIQGAPLIRRAEHLLVHTPLVRFVVQQIHDESAANRTCSGVWALLRHRVDTSSTKQCVIVANCVLNERDTISNYRRWSIPCLPVCLPQI